MKKTPAPPATSEEANEALLAAFRHKMLNILAMPLTARSLHELATTTDLARRALVLGQAPGALHHGPHVAPAYPYNDGLVGTAMAPLPMQPAFSPPAENFGATLVRELLAILASKGKAAAPAAATNADLDGMVAALALAREKGLHDVAAKLEAQLLHAAAVSTNASTATSTALTLDAASNASPPAQPIPAPTSVNGVVEAAVAS